MHKFINIFQLILDKHAPLPKRSRKELKRKTKPWITKGLLKSIHRKNCMYKKCVNSKSTAKWDEYKMYRNKLTHLKNPAKKLYYQDIIRKNKQNTAKLWKTINHRWAVPRYRYRGPFLVPVPVPSVLLWYRYRYRQKIAKYRGTVPVL